MAQQTDTQLRGKLMYSVFVLSHCLAYESVLWRPICPGCHRAAQEEDGEEALLGKWSCLFSEDNFNGRGAGGKAFPCHYLCEKL